jgi:hypothetical protein
MPGTTVRGYPYPTDTDPIDVAGDIQALAEAIDTSVTTVSKQDAFGVPMVFGTIPQIVVISGAVGTQPTNPRVFGLSNVYRSKGAPFQAVNGVAIRILEAGIYRCYAQIKHIAWWAYFASVRQIRATTPVNVYTSQMSRGTWGNPSGVIGFDQGHSGMINVNMITVAAVGDEIQFSSYTSGGGDTTSLGGGDGSMFYIEQLRQDTNHEDATVAPTSAVELSEDLPAWIDLPIAFIRRPGYPETFPPGEEDPGV